MLSLLYRWIPVRAFSATRHSRDLSNFCASLALRLRAGETVPAALGAAAEAYASNRARETVLWARDFSLQGAPLSVALPLRGWIARNMFPQTLIWALAQAEASGDVPDVLASFARLHAAEAERGLERKQAFLPFQGVLVLVNAFALEAAIVLFGRFGVFSYLLGEDSGAAFFLFLLAAVNLPFLLILAPMFRFHVSRPGRLAFLLRHLAWMIRYDWPLSEGFECLASGMRWPFSGRLRRMAARLAEGRSLPDVMRAFPGFDALPLRRIAVFEGRGTGLAEYLEDEAHRRERPAVPSHGILYVFVLMLLLFGLVSLMGSDSVRSGLATGSFIAAPWPIYRLYDATASFYVFSLLLLSIVALPYLGAYLNAARWLGWFPVLLWEAGLRLPLARRALREDAAASFSAMAGRLLHAGVPLPEVLLRLASSEPVWTLRRLYRRLARRLSEGASLEPLVREARLLPALLAWYVRAGESSGRLGAYLLEAADEFFARAGAARARAIGALWPLLALAAGGLAYSCLLGLLEPYWSLLLRITGAP